MNEGPLARLARVCYRRRRTVLVAWIVGTLVVMAAGFAFAAKADNDFGGGKSDSARATDLIKKHFPGRDGDTLTLAIRADNGLAAAKPAVEPVLAALAKAPHATSVSSPYQMPQQVSPDKHTAFAAVQLDGTPTVDQVKKLVADVKAASGKDGVRMALGGSELVQQAETPQGGPTEGIGVLAAMVILLIAFGSLLAMGLPIVTALFGIGSGLAGIMLLGHLLPSPSFGPIVAAMIGLGVGVDYALFIVTRYREGLERGQDPEEATVTALTTAGRSVLFAGSTVVIAMLGLFVMQQRLLNAVAVAASVTVLMTMITAVTLLPALLGFTGRNIDKLRLPMLGRTRSASPLATRWSHVIQRRPVIALVLAAASLLVLAVPALSMRLGMPDSSTMPHNTGSYASHKLLAEGFGSGYDAPLVVVSAKTDLKPLAAEVGRTPGVASVTPVLPSDDGQASMFIAYPKTSQLDQATSTLAHTLRDKVFPPDGKVYLGGPNAGSIDFADSVKSRLPWLIAVVVALALLVLLVLVRSLVIAVKAAVMTLLSVVVAYGVLTAIVQWGWLSGLLGFTGPMPITTWVPLMMFPILFGLSTDYEVFLIARIREEYDAGKPTRQAVTDGLAHTARVITAAAAIMVAVFLTVLLGADQSVKQFGLGLAVAVFVDATVVRMILVPALMELLGNLNWWLPRPLARILPTPEPRRVVPAAEPVGVE